MNKRARALGFIKALCFVGVRIRGELSRKDFPLVFVIKMDVAPGNSRVFSEKGPSLYGGGALSSRMIDGWGPRAGMGFPKFLGCLRRKSMGGYEGSLWGI